MEQLSEEKFLLFAMKNYSAPACLDIEEFNEEVRRFRYISRAFKLESINTQLVLNHIIILYNVFGVAATEMLLFKVDRDCWKFLVPFLVYLNRLTIEQLDDILLTTKLDENIIDELRAL